MGCGEHADLPGEDKTVRNGTAYQRDLIEALKDPQKAEVYLNAAIAAGDKQAFLLALKNVAEAHGGE